MTPVRLEPAALRSRVKHSTTEPLRSHVVHVVIRGPIQSLLKQLKFKLHQDHEVNGSSAATGFSVKYSVYSFASLQDCESYGLKAIFLMHGLFYT